MANDIHVWLSDEDAAALRERAKSEVRSITNMATVLIRRGLAAQNPVDEDRPRRGRPRKEAMESPPPIETKIDLSDDGLADHVDRERYQP